ncbi:MAG TPA: shikimate kinase [Pseudolysinimonas sp.]|nr:shikimate kinase [Pseudolysinimonas sp.]
MPDLVFIGPSGAGKSRLGKRVAKILGVPFADTDKMVVAEYGPIAGIFAEFGEGRFRELERAAVIRGLQGEGVLSLGGGAVLDAATRSDLAHERVVLLTVSPEAVEARLGDKRPLVANGIAEWVALNDTRWPLYESLADATFDTSVGSDADLAEEVARWAQQTT